MSPSSLCPCWSKDSPDDNIDAYRSGLEQALGIVRQAARRPPLDDEAIKLLHSLMFSAIVPLDYYAGNFRCDDARRICLGVNVQVGGIEGADFYAVPETMAAFAQEVETALSDLELRWAQLSPERHALDLANLTAYSVSTFIQIHPFINGNGRTSRLLWRWFLTRFNLRSQVRLAPRPDPPYSELMAHCMRKDWRPLALFILHSMERCPERS